MAAASCNPLASRWPKAATARVLSLFVLSFGLPLLAGCDRMNVAAAPAKDSFGMRVVSLDVCADQYVLEMLDRDRILAVSPDATSDFSYLREKAHGLPVVRPVAEDVLVLQPDLVVRAYGGGPGASEFFRRAGIPVLTVGWASDIPAVVDIIENFAAGLGVPERGAAIIADMQARLARVATPAEARTALYMTPAGVTTGPGSLVHELLVAAGFENFQRRAGWNPLPLERLAYAAPDRVAAAFFDTQTSHPDGWSPMRHPIARAQLAERDPIFLSGAWTACAGWFAIDAVEALGARNIP